MYTDPDGNKVPVPYGFTVSGAESEKYVNGFNVEKKGTWTDVFLSSDGDYPWTLNGQGIWENGNSSVRMSTSELTSEEISIGENGGNLHVEWGVNEYYGYGSLALNILNTNTGNSRNIATITGQYQHFVLSSSGYYYTKYDSFYTEYNEELEPGNYIITFIYNRRSIDSFSGAGTGYVRNVKVFNYSDTGIDVKTIHQYGGFVIYEGEVDAKNENEWTEEETLQASIDKNQFVWVPVNDINRIYELDADTGRFRSLYWTYEKMGFDEPVQLVKHLTSYNDTSAEPGIIYQDYKNARTSRLTTGYTGDLFYKELQDEFRKTIKSIEKYGGFYIGRYETSNFSSTIPIVRRLKNNNDMPNWYTQYVKIKNISNNKNIQTNMIWKNLWSETLRWLIDTGEKSTMEIWDATSWGIYGTPQLTGSMEKTKTNNIYDLAGNYPEYTLEGYGSNRKTVGLNQKNGLVSPVYDGSGNLPDNTRKCS